MNIAKGTGAPWARLRIAVAAALWLTVAGAAPAARYRPRPWSSIPILTLTSRAPGARAIETRMARFILALQANNREAASRLLSQRLEPARRRAFLKGTWLRRNSAQDFGIVYFLPAIRLRTRGVSGSRAVVRVEPLTPFAPKTMAIGFIDVPMYRERGEWRINPTPVAVRRAGKPATRTVQKQ
jgi:hypothetical protein